MIRLSDVPKTPHHSVGKVIVNNLKMYAVIFRAEPVLFILWMLWGVTGGVFQSVDKLFCVWLFNAIDMNAAWWPAVRIILMMAAIQVLFLLQDGVFSFIRPILADKMKLRLTDALLRKSREFELGCYDDPCFYNELIWAVSDTGKRAESMMWDLHRIIRNLTSAGVLFSLLFSIDRIVGAVLLANAVFFTVSLQCKNRVQYAQQMEYRPYARHESYYRRVFFLSDYAKELRCSRAHELLLRGYDETVEIYLKADKRYAMTYFFYFGLLSRFVTFLVTFGITVYMTVRLAAGEVPTGSFAAMIGIAWSVRWQLNDLVNRLTNLSKQSLYIEKYLGFTGYKPKISGGKKEAGPFESLEIRGVSFAYDFTSHAETLDGMLTNSTPPAPVQALTDVSLCVRRGEKIAIVGYNGAGKTTLTKLIMRFYDPDKGQILYNGVDIREYDLESYRRRIGAVFQDFHIFATTLAENVMAGPYSPPRDEQTVRTALQAAGFSPEEVVPAHGLDTQLTKEFDENGVNLSGGEAQKVVIASAFARSCDLMIMDEPSSALDPLAEYHLNQSILAYSRDRTVIFIAHRLSTTAMADRIYMFSGTRLIESGTHAELMAQKGAYAEMFDMQSETYKKGIGASL